MTWARMDDGLPEHPKSDALEVAAGSWQVYAVACMAWRDMCCDCSRRLTDGAFTRQRAHRVLRAPAKIVDKALAALLVAGFLDAGEGPDAFQFHDWATYNPTRAKVEAERESKTKRQQRWRGGASTDGGGDSDVDASTQPSRDASTAPSVEPLPHARVPVPSRPVPSRPDSDSEPVDGARSAPPTGVDAASPETPDPEADELATLRAEKAAREAAEADARRLAAEKGEARRRRNREKAKAREENPPPFSIGAAFEAIAAASKGRFVPGVERDWTGGVRIAVAKLIRTYPTIAEWERLGRWLDAGGDGFRKIVGPSWAASTGCVDAMARSREWEAQGGGPIAAAPMQLTPQPDRFGRVPLAPVHPAVVKRGDLAVDRPAMAPGSPEALACIAEARAANPEMFARLDARRAAKAANGVR